MRETSTTVRPVESPAGREGSRALSGLFLVFVLSLLSFVGVWLTALAFGGTDGWSRWQFIGFFGLVETAAGLGNIISPNVWRLPVAEVQTRPSTKIHLAASTILMPHWGGAARAVAGLLMVIISLVAEGAGPATLGVPPIIFLFGVVMLALSLVCARWGVDHPDIDVVQFVVRRAGKEHEIPAISIGASILQMLVSIVTLPAIAILPPSGFFQPELGPSNEVLAWSALAAVISVGLVLLVWWGRIDWHAPADQQREAERFA